MVPPDERHPRHPHPVGGAHRPVRGRFPGRNRDGVLCDGLRLPTPCLLGARRDVCGAARVSGGSRTRSPRGILGGSPVLRVHEWCPPGHRVADAPPVPQQLLLWPGGPTVRAGHLLLRVRAARPQGARLFPDDGDQHRTGCLHRRVLPLRDDAADPAPPRLQTGAPPKRHHGGVPYTRTSTRRCPPTRSWPPCPPWLPSSSWLPPSVGHGGCP